MRVWLVVLLLGTGTPAHAEDPAPSDVYVRRPMQIEDTVRFLGQEVKRLGVGQVLIALDVTTFAPPPGLTEFSVDYPYYEDLTAWTQALAAWAADAGISVRATSSLATKSIDLTKPHADRALEVIVKRNWWKGADAVTKIPRATQWMKQLLDRTEQGAMPNGVPTPRMLVLITGSVTPERWIPNTNVGFESPWRRRLLPVGTYFDEAAVGAALQQRGCRLYVVAPESHFGEHGARRELPSLPWAARPQRPATGASPSGADTRGVDLEGLPPDVREQIEKALRDGIGGGGVREGVPGKPGRRPTTPNTRPTPERLQTRHGGLRFAASTPFWFPHVGSGVPFNNHAPSGYGEWSYARAAAKTGGKYVFYPFPESRWLDRCPADAALLNRLAPELVSRQRYLALRKGDTALHAISRASTLVIDDTPWADSSWNHRAARAWSAFLGVSPLRMEDTVFRLRKPFDAALQNSEHGMKRIGRDLLEKTLPQYDKALALLDRARKRVASGKMKCHPRSVANLALARFWFSMSAFHLHAYAIYASEIERFIPDDMKGRVDRIYVTYVPTIRLSDCLDGYEGRSLSLADEAKYKRWVPSGAPAYQGNLLDIAAEDPNFRARRCLPSVVRYLDPRLRKRAVDMISSAQAVMKDYARTGWGWTTYYADAYTFVFKPVPVQTGHRPSRGGGRPPPRPTTPRGGGPQTGSNPGGPATGK